MRAKTILTIFLCSLSLTACGGRVPSTLAQEPPAEEPGAPPVDENPPAPPTDTQPAPGGNLQEQAQLAWSHINANGDEHITPEELTAFFQSVIDAGAVATARMSPFRTQQYRPLPPPQMQRMAIPPTLRRMDGTAGVAELMTQDFFTRFDSDANSLLTYTEFETGFIALAQEGQSIQAYAARNVHGARIMRMRQALLTGR